MAWDVRTFFTLCLVGVLDIYRWKSVACPKRLLFWMELICLQLLCPIIGANLLKKGQKELFFYIGQYFSCYMSKMSWM